MRAILCVGLLWLANAATAEEDIPAEVPAKERKEAIEQMKRGAERFAKLTRLQKEWTEQIAGIKTSVIDPKVKTVSIPAGAIDKKNPIRFQSATARNAFRMDLEEKLNSASRELKETIGTRPEHFTDPLTLTKVGEIGRFPHQEVKVLGVLTKSTGALSTFTAPISETPAKLPKSERIMVIISKTDTTKWADDLTVPAPEGAFYVGTVKRRTSTHLHLIRIELTKEESAEIMKIANPSEPK